MCLKTLASSDSTALTVINVNYSLIKVTQSSSGPLLVFLHSCKSAKIKKYEQRIPSIAALNLVKVSLNIGTIASISKLACDF